MTFEQMFTYHPPNERTTPRYIAVNHAEAEAVAVIERIRLTGEQAPGADKPAELFAIVNAAAMTMSANVGEGGPALYFSAAIQNIILFRNACNEALVIIQSAAGLEGPAATTRLRPVHRLLAMAGAFAQQYRWLANGAVAVGDALAVDVTP